MLIALEVLQAYTSMVRETLDMDGDTPALDHLRQHSGRLTGEHDDTRFRCGGMIGNFAAAMSSHPKLRSAIEGHFEGWNEAIAELLRQAQKAAELTVEHDAEELSRYFLNSFQGALLGLTLWPGTRWTSF